MIPCCFEPCIRNRQSLYGKQTRTFEGGNRFSDGDFPGRENNRFFVGNKVKYNIFCICMVFQYDSVGRLF